MSTPSAVAVPLVAAFLAVGATFMLGMRYKWPFVLDGVRRMNRRFLNPLQMRTAGTPGAYAGIIHHVGRRSGRAYQTPVGIVAAHDEIYIVLPYGTRPDWLKNVLEAGTAKINHEGATFEVDRPELIKTRDVPEIFGSTEQVAQRLFGVERCLRLRLARQTSNRH